MAWQTRASFERMMTNYYIPEMINRREKLHKTDTPILLLLDGHTSRLSLPIIEECASKNIILMILPSHTSNTTQPLDCDPNGVLKAQFCKECAIRVNLQSDNHEVLADTTNIKPNDNASSASLPTENQTMLDKVSSIIFPVSGPFVGTSVAHRNLLRNVLPIAIETATLTRCIENGWRKSRLAPYNPDTALAALPEGRLIPDPKNYPPISGKVITDPKMRICIYNWKLQQAERRLSKLNPTSSDYIETNEEIKLLTSTLESIKPKPLATSGKGSEPCSQLLLSIDDQKQTSEEMDKNEAKQKEDAALKEDSKKAGCAQYELTEEEVEQFTKPRKRTLEEIEESTCLKKEPKQKRHPVQRTRAPSTRNHTIKISKDVVSWDDFEELENWPD